MASQDVYRERATKAEQENARLRAELAKKPNFKWFLDQVRAMVKLPSDATPNQVVQQVKSLRDNKDLYISYTPDRKRTEEEEREIFARGREAGRNDALVILKNAFGRNDG